MEALTTGLKSYYSQFLKFDRIFFATSLALYLGTPPLGSYLILKTHLLPTTLIECVC